MFWNGKKNNPSLHLELLPNNQLYIKCNFPKCDNDEQILIEAKRFSELVFVMSTGWILPKVKAAIGAAGPERLASEIILQFEQLQAEMAEQARQQMNLGPAPGDEVVPPGRIFNYGANQ